MASTTTIIPARSSLELVFIEGENTRMQPVEIIGYQVDEKGKATPITYPAVPAKAQVFIKRDGGFKPFDLATGRTTGQTVTLPAWVKE